MVSVKYVNIGAAKPPDPPRARTRGPIGELCWLFNNIANTLWLDGGVAVGGELFAVLFLGREPAGEALFEDLGLQEHDVPERLVAALVILVVLAQELGAR